MKTLRFSVSLAIGVVFAIGTFIFLKSRFSDKVTSASIQVAALPPTTHTSTVSLLHGYTWHTGAVASYNCEVHFRLAPAGSPLTSDPNAGLAVAARLHFRVEKVDSDKVVLAGTATQVSVRRDGRTQDAIAALVRSAGTRITISPEGHIREVAYPKHIPRDDRQILDLFYKWEFVVRSEPSWETDELPTFSAHYTRDTASTGIVKERRLIATSVQQQQLLGSTFRGVVGPFWLRTLSGAEDSVMLLNSKPFLSGHVDVTMLLADTPDADGIAALPASTVLADFTSEPDPDAKSGVLAAIRRQEKRERLIHVPLPSRIEELNRLADGRMAKISKPLQEMRDYLSAFPEVTPELLLRLRQPENSGNLTGLLVHALASAGHPEAQAAIAEIIRSKVLFPKDVFHQAIVAAGSMPPSESTALALWSLATDSNEDPSSQAAAWNALGRWAELDSATRARLTSILEDRVDPTRFAASDVINTLHTAANGRIDSDRLRENAAKILTTSSTVDQRTAAIDYFAALGDRALLRERLLLEPDPQVSSAILNHLFDPASGGLQGDEPALIIKLAARPSTPESVREIAISILAHSNVPMP